MGQTLEVLQNPAQSGHGHKVLLVASGICARCELSLKAIKQTGI